MPFSGDDFKRLGLPPYAGALARELQNLADGLTTVNTNGGGGFTLHQDAAAPADSLGADGDWYLNTSDGSWYDKVSGSWVIRYTDQLGAAGTTDGVASGISFAKAGSTVTATVARTQNLDALTGSFDVFSGAYSDLSGLPTLFSGDYPDLTNKPTIPAATPENRLIPSGGTAAQVLTKVDANDYEVNWTTLPTGGGGSGDDAFPWATEGNTDNVPDNKLNDLILTRIDGFTYIPASRNIVLTLERLDGTTNIAQVQLPEFLAPATVEPFALTANPNTTVPGEKLPTHIIGVVPRYDDQTKILGIERTTTAGSVVTSSVTLPNWIENSDVQQWAKAGDTSRLPYNKLPSLLRSAHTLTYDTSSRELAILFRNTDLVDIELAVTLPNFVTSVTGFDLHDNVTDTAPIQDPDRLVFSDENVAGDPMRYVTAVDLSNYVLGNLVPADIPASIARDDEIEEWARVGNQLSLIPFEKLETTVVRSIGAFTFDPANERLTITTLLSSGTFESTHVDFPDYITSAAVENWAKVGDGSQLPTSKIPNLGTGKIIGLTEFLDDRVGNQLIQHGDNLVWTYDDAAGQLTGNVSTNTDDVTQIIRDVVNPLGPGLTESFSPSLNRLNIGLDIDTVIQVGSNMTKSVTGGVITLNATAMGGAGINAEDAVDAVAAALTGGSKISVSYDDPNNEIEISTTALNASEVNTRIDTRILSLLPTVTAGEASIDDGDERRIWTSRRVRQAANLSAQTHIVGVASPIDVADPTTNTDVFAASKQSVAQAIFDNMGTGGMADGIVNSLDLSRSGRDLTVTLGRSIGADLAETVQLPEDENRFVDSLGVLVTGQTLTVTLGRTAPLPDLVDTATLPTGGMGGGTDTNDFVTGGAFTLSGQELSLQLTGTPGFTTVDFPAITLPGGGGGGDDAFDWATVGDTSLVPTDKLGPGVANADRILRGNQTWGRINANTLTANFLNTGSPDEADYMLFADSGPGRQLSFITYSGFLDGIAGAGLIHGGETLHLDATGATTGQVFSYTGDGTTLNFDWIDLPTGGGGGTTVSANPTGLQTAATKDRYHRLDRLSGS